LEHDFIRASILDRDAVRGAVQGVDYVFHLAAIASVPESSAKPSECYELNTNGTSIVLEEAARAGVKKFVLSSSAAVYGDNPALPKVENMLPEPKGPYAISKLNAELHCQRFSEMHRIPTACLRYFNVYGPRQDSGGQYPTAVPIFINHALEGKQITIFGDGKQTRDFIYVKDISAANAWIATESTATGAFNVGHGSKTTIYDLATTICRLTVSRSEVQHAPERTGDIKHSLASIDKLRNAGFTPRWSFADGIQATIDCFQT
jgi:UDP-glucose 4-epimerase